MSVLSDFAERLNGLMEQKNIKSTQLGKELGVSGSVVRYWQRAEKQVSLPNLLKLADYFGCTMDYLAGQSDNKEMTFVPQTPPPFSQALRRALVSIGATIYKLATYTKFNYSYIYS